MIDTFLTHLVPGDPKKLHKADRKHFLERKCYEDKQGTVSASFEMLLGQFKICVLSKETVSKMRPFPVHFLESVKKD